MKKRLIVIISVLILSCTIFSLKANRAYAADQLLYYGCSGDQVIKLQQQLKDKGYFNASTTGYFGSITYNSVINFQKDNSLAVDGIVGPKTWAKLNNTNSNTSDKINQDIYWLSRIIEAEASGECYTGKVAVGNVIMNRVKSPDFPNTIYNVIFDSYNGIPQFSPVANGTIYNTPSSDSICAAKDAYNGSRPVGDALFFFNPDKAAASWIVNTRTYVTRIGNHVFYK